MVNIRKHLLKIDMLAPSVQLRIAGNTSSKSLVGVVLFLGYLGFAIWTCFVQFLDYQDTTQPGIHTDNTFLAGHPEFDLTASGSIPIIIGSYRTTRYVKPDELRSYFSLKMYVTGLDLVVATGEIKYLLTEVPIIPCKRLLDSGELDLSHLEGIPKAYLEIIPEYGMCANTTGFDVTVVGSNADNFSKLVEILISPCSLPGGVGCKPAVEVNRMWIQTLSPRIGLNVSSQSNPVHSRYFPDDLFPLNVNNLQLFKYEMVKNEISDSFGFMMKDRHTRSFATQIAQPPSWKYRDPPVLFAAEKDLHYLTTAPYVVITWASGTKFNLIRRNYQGIIDLVSNIGGLNSIFWALATWLHTLLHPMFERRRLVRKVFAIETLSRFSTFCSWKKKRSDPLNIAKPDLQGAKEEAAIGSSFSPHITSNSPYTIVSKEVFEEASKIIENDLDVVSICKQLHELRILVGLLMKKDQTELIPLATLCRSNPEQIKKQSLRTRSNCSHSRLSGSTNRTMIPGESEIKESMTERRLLTTATRKLNPSLLSDVPADDNPQVIKSPNPEPEIELKPNKVFKAVLEGLEEEFNKLIRTEVVGFIPGKLESGVSVGIGLQRQITSMFKKSGIGNSDFEVPPAKLSTREGWSNIYEVKLEPFQQSGVGAMPSSQHDARPNSNILSNPIPVRLKYKRPQRSARILSIPQHHKPSNFPT